MFVGQINFIFVLGNSPNCRIRLIVELLLLAIGFLPRSGKRIVGRLYTFFDALDNCIVNLFVGN